MKRFLFVAVAAAVVTATHLGAMIPEQVKIESGLLAGTASGQPTVRVFKGIPFAAPPLGENRWKAPQPAAKWEGVRKADAFGAPCAAGPAGGGRGGGRGAAPGAAAAAPGAPAATPPAPVAPPREPARSEDCLYLNVWTSANNANDRRPVMVWIYGGGFTGGSGGLAWYDGENLAAKGPVIVTINYRLGSLGFFAHPELAKESGHNAAGNYGMMDAIAALQWVKKNISAFGGDPNNVTIAGESAGAIMVGALVGSPQAKGLFNRAIAQSGGWMGLTMGRMTPGQTAQANGVKTMEALGVKTIAELRAKPLNELTGLSAGGLIVDGYIIPEDMSLTFQNGRQNAVDVLTGSNKDEANFGVCGGGGGRGGGAPMTAETFKANAQRKFGEAADDFVKLYGVTTDAEAQPADAHGVRRRDQLEHAAVGSGAGQRRQEGLHLLLHPHSDVERRALAARRDAHRGDLVRVEQPQGSGDSDVERRRHQAGRPDVVVLGQLHHQGRSERQRPAAMARVQGPDGRAGDGARRHGAGRIGGADGEAVLLPGRFQRLLKTAGTN